MPLLKPNQIFMKKPYTEGYGHKKRATTIRIAVTPHTMKHYNLSLFKKKFKSIIGIFKSINLSTFFLE